MWRMAYVLLFLLLGSAFFPARAASEAVLEPAESLGAYHHTAFRQQDGAPSDIGDIAQDRDGFLWVIGSKGVTRFDGRTFVPWMPTGDTFHEAQIFHMVAAPEGGLWLTYLHHSPSLLLKTQLFNGRLSDAGGRGRIFVDALDNVWVLNGRGLSKLQGREWIHADYPPPAVRKSGCGFASSDEEGNIWYNCEDEILYLPKGAMTSVRTAIQVPDLVKVYAGRTGLVVVSTQNDLYFFRASGATLTPIMAPVKLYASKVYQDRDGAIWITSASLGVSYLSTQALATAERTRSAPVLESLGKADGLTGQLGDTIFQDRDGNVWISSESGLDRFSRSAFTTIRFPHNLHEVSVGVDDDGSLWVGNESISMLHGMPSGPWTVLPGDFRFSLSVYRNAYSGSIVTSVRSGFYLVNRGVTKKIAEQPPSTLTSIAGSQCYAVNREDAVVVCTAGDQGPSIWKGDAWQPIGLPQNDVSAITVDGGDRVWMGRGEHAQLVVWDKGSIKTFDLPAPDLGRITVLFADAEGVWIGREHGVTFFDGAHFHAISVDQPDLLEPVTGVVRDASGALWMQSLDGVFRLGKDDVLAALGDPSLKLHPQQYGAADGIDGAPDPDHCLPSLRLDGRGRVWAQSSSGLAWIDPSRPSVPAATPPTFIESIKSGNSVVQAPGGTISLNSKQEAIRISFASPTLARPDLVRFSYRLVGLESDWRDAGASYQADYNFIPPGKYRFEVRMLTTDGHQVLSTASIPIDRAPAVFETWWFKSLAVLPLAAVIWLLFQLRMQVMLRNERIRSDEREAVARDIHDTLLQRFQGVIMTVQAWALDEGIPSKRRAEALRISSQARDAMLEGRERVLKLRSGEDRGLLLYDRLLHEAEHLRERHSLHFAIEVTGSPRALTVACEHELGDAAVEGIRNAFAHSGGTTVTVTINYTPRALWLLVADDGNGMPKEPGPARGERPSFGVIGMRERVSRLGGDLTIESSPEEGTILHMCVPARQAYTHRKKRNTVSS